METNELLAQVDALKAEIDKLRPLKPEVEHRVMQKFRLDWNYHSNAIEGNSLTLGETRAFLMEGLTASGKPLKDHLDIKGHNELIDFLLLFIQRKEELTESDIRGMHKILLREPYQTEAVTLEGQIVKKWVKLGEYKSTPNFVRMGSGDVHQYASPEDVSPRMAELVRWHREQTHTSELHPVVHAALFHHRFLAIHPFDDGNGRLGRILMNLILMRLGFPPVVIKLSERDPYVAALRKADVGEPAGIVAYVAQCLADSERLFIRGAKGEAIEDADDVDKQVVLLKQELRNVEKPVELSGALQARIIDERILPLLARIDQKLKQFDELFARSSATVQFRFMNGTGSTFSGDKSRVAAGIRDLMREDKLLEHLHIHYHWEGFLLDGPNDFSIQIDLRIRFEQRKYSLDSNSFGRVWQHLYQSWFADDELRDFVTRMAKAVLNEIEKRRTRERAR